MICLKPHVTSEMSSHKRCLVVSAHRRSQSGCMECSSFSVLACFWFGLARLSVWALLQLA